MKKKAILIDEDVHQLVKMYCANNNLKIKEWVERILVKNMEQPNDKVLRVH
jgi:hypothetical protein